MNATVPQVTVGTVMIFRANYEADPITVNVSRVTKGGWVRFTYPSGPDAGKESSNYKPARYGEGYAPADNPRYAKASLIRFSEEKMAELTEASAKRRQAIAEKRDEENARIEAIKQREADQLAEVKKLLDGNFNRVAMHREVLNAAGEAILMLKLPVKAELVERKGDFQVVVLKVAKYKHNRYGQNDQWVAYPTYADKTTSSWSSISGSYAASADDAVWEALRYLYNNW